MNSSMRWRIILTTDWRELDENLITSEVCMDCGRCCKTTWIQPRWTHHNEHPDSDKLPYLQAMFGKSSRSYVEERGDKVAVVNWCSNLQPDLSCGIYKDRPGMCRAYNCFKAANGSKRLPEYWTHIKKLVERVHGVSPYKRRNQETASQSSDDSNVGSIRTDAPKNGR